uniref:Toll/interleukin-1 receptor (TIR) domain-containing protein n=1 Tax=Tanacetum cinerariifolium TaxID=118510 RepID=A0A6L2P7N5_TANCI|nr:Toll/interleukin-1 receptor (TIR) domain-containing protein [Tanacetum cinerariifolium]
MSPIYTSNLVLGPSFPIDLSRLSQRRNCHLAIQRCTAALPRHGKRSCDEEKKEKVQGEMSSKELVKKRFFSTGHRVKLEEMFTLALSDPSSITLVSKPSLSGLKKPQKNILKDILHRQDISFTGVHDGRDMLIAKKHGASTSSSSIHRRIKYDVLISFRGEDTRKTFVGHLYQALQAKCIETYKDDEKMMHGKIINNQLIQAIKDSRFFIIVFSKNYASSSWCLGELVEIMELNMEYLVKISKKARILRRNMKIADSNTQYAVSIKEDTAYLCLHYTKDHEGNKTNTSYSEDLNTPMDNPNITMEEYIRLEKKKLEYVGNCLTGNLLTIVFKDNLTSNETLSCEPTVSSLNNNEIDFRISFYKSDNEDYTIVFDKHLFSYKITSTNDLKTDSENDNEKVNNPLFPSPKPTVSCIDDLNFFKDFENEFPTIVYNDALTSKSDFSTEPTLCPQHIDEFDLKDKTSLSEYDAEEKNVLYFNNLFPFNIIYHDDLKSDKGDDDNEIDMIQFLRGNENTQGSNKLLEESHGIKYMALPPIDQRHQYLRHEGLQYTDADIVDFETILARDPMLRLCHKLIACRIAGRIQAHEKVIVTDLFYLRGMDVDSVNVPYLLARVLYKVVDIAACLVKVWDDWEVDRYENANLGLRKKYRLSLKNDMPPQDKGDGKTTVTRAVIDYLFADSKAKSFIGNVREVSNASMFGLKNLQEQVLSNVLNEQVTLNSFDDRKDMMKRRMFGKKVLLVLDDVDHIEQLKALVEQEVISLFSRQRGHIMKTCPMMKQKEEIERIINKIETAKENMEGLMASKPTVSIKYPESIYFETKCMLKGTYQGHWDNIWYVSNNTNMHLCPKLSLFCNIREKFIVNKLDDQKMFLFTYGLGEVVINNGDKGYLIPGVSYAPEVTLNILSLELLEKQGFEIMYENNTCSLVYMFKDPKG